MTTDGSRLPALAGSDGRTHDLAAESADAPLFLHAIKYGCPIHAEAAEFVDRLAHAYAGRVRLLGLSDLDATRFPAWRARFAPPFPVLFDPGLAVVRALGVQGSPWMVRLERGTPTGSWPGHGREPLAAVEAAFAAAAGGPAGAVDLAGAPERTRYG